MPFPDVNVKWETLTPEEAAKWADHFEKCGGIGEPWSPSANHHPLSDYPESEPGGGYPPSPSPSDHANDPPQVHPWIKNFTVTRLPWSEEASEHVNRSEQEPFIYPQTQSNKISESWRVRVQYDLTTTDSERNGRIIDENIQDAHEEGAGLFPNDQEQPLSNLAKVHQSAPETQPAIEFTCRRTPERFSDDGHEAGLGFVPSSEMKSPCPNGAGSLFVEAQPQAKSPRRSAEGSSCDGHGEIKAFPPDDEDERPPHLWLVRAESRSSSDLREYGTYERISQIFRPSKRKLPLESLPSQEKKRRTSIEDPSPTSLATSLSMHLSSPPATSTELESVAPNNPSLPFSQTVAAIGRDVRKRKKPSSKTRKAIATSSAASLLHTVDKLNPMIEHSQAASVPNTPSGEDSSQISPNHTQHPAALDSSDSLASPHIPRRLHIPKSQIKKAQQQAYQKMTPAQHPTDEDEEVEMLDLEEPPKQCLKPIVLVPIRISYDAKHVPDTASVPAEKDDPPKNIGKRGRQPSRQTGGGEMKEDRYSPYKIPSSSKRVTRSSDEKRKKFLKLDISGKASQAWGATQRL